MAIRKDLLSKQMLKVIEARRRYIQVGLQDEELECGVGCVYIPPEGSRYYSDEETDHVFDMARNCGIVADDLNWRAARAD